MKSEPYSLKSGREVNSGGLSGHSVEQPSHKKKKQTYFKEDFMFVFIREADRAADSDLSPLSYRIILKIIGNSGMNNGGGLTRSQMSKILKVDKSYVSRAVNELIKQRLVSENAGRKLAMAAQAGWRGQSSGRTKAIEKQMRAHIKLVAGTDVKQ